MVEVEQVGPVERSLEDVEDVDGFIRSHGLEAGRQDQLKVVTFAAAVSETMPTSTVSSGFFRSLKVCPGDHLVGSTVATVEAPAAPLLPGAAGWPGAWRPDGFAAPSVFLGHPPSAVTDNTATMATA